MLGHPLLRAAPFVTLLTLTIGCGSNPPPAPATPTADSAPTAATAPPDKHALAEAAPHVDPNEKETAIDLVALVTQTSKPAYPKQNVGDLECLKDFPFSGHHKADYQTLVDKCGSPTGMVAYTTPAEGRLHAKHDQRDLFNLKVQKGMCYRYFAVADDGIKDIDIVISKRGALMATDRTEQPIAVIDTEKLWCMDEDIDLQFSIEIDGPGAGGYTFGVWTRPKK